MTSSNPTLRGFNNVGAMGVSYAQSDTMTVDGTIGKTGLLAVILAVAFAFTWTGLTQTGVPPTLPIVGGILGGLVLALIISFKPTTAPYLSPVYAAVEGLVLAAISYPLEMAFPHIVVQAASLTIVTLFAMLIAYRTRLIVVNETFRAVVVGATMAVLFYYIANLVGMLIFHVALPGYGFQGGWLAIGISGVIVVIAAMNLALDFDMIAQNAGSAPKYMEWYGAFSLMVTIIWLYLTILRLLGNMRRN